MKNDWSNYVNSLLKLLHPYNGKYAYVFGCYFNGKLDNCEPYSNLAKRFIKLIQFQGGSQNGHYSNTFSI